LNDTDRYDFEAGNVDHFRENGLSLTGITAAEITSGPRDGDVWALDWTYIINHTKQENGIPYERRGGSELPPPVPYGCSGQHPPGKARAARPPSHNPSSPQKHAKLNKLLSAPKPLCAIRCSGGGARSLCCHVSTPPRQMHADRLLIANQGACSQTQSSEQI
jgi:hypothetical protein